jgi:hypothetical protein
VAAASIGLQAHADTKLPPQVQPAATGR